MCVMPQLGRVRYFLVVAALLVVQDAALEHRMADQTDVGDAVDSDIDILQLQDSVELIEIEDGDLQTAQDWNGAGTPAPTIASMDNEQLEKAIESKREAASKRDEMAHKMALNDRTIRSNETELAGSYLAELQRIQANYTAYLEKAKFDLEKPYIKQAASIVAEAFQQAAVKNQVGAAIDKCLRDAETLKLKNLDTIASQKEMVSDNNTIGIVSDFVQSAINAAENMQQAPPLVVMPTAPSGGGQGSAGGVDATSLYEDEVQMEDEDLGEGAEQQTVPATTFEDPAAAGAPEKDTSQKSEAENIESMVMGIAEKELGVPPVPTLIDPNDEPPKPSPEANTTSQDNPYKAIVKLGENTTAGMLARNALVDKETKKMKRMIHEMRKDSWDNEIWSKSNLKARENILSKKNKTQALLHEKLRQELNLNVNETAEKIQEHLIEEQASPHSVKGQRIVLEYSTMIEDMRVNDALFERADEALGQRLMDDVMPRLIEAYSPMVEYREEQEVQNNAHEQAQTLVTSRINGIKTEKEAAIKGKTAAEMALQKAMNSAGNEEDATEAQIQTKINQIFTYVQNFGDATLISQMQNAMDELQKAKAASNIGAAAAAQSDLDNAIATASGAIGGSTGDDILRLKIEIDALKNPADELADEADAVQNGAGNSSLVDISIPPV